MTGQGLDGLDGHARLLQPGEAGVAEFVTGPMHQAGPGPCRAEHFIQSLGGEGLAPSRLFQDDEQMVSGGLGWSFPVQVVGHRREEGRRDGHQPLVATLTVDDEQLLLAGPEVLHAQTQHLAPTKTPEQHGLGHGPVSIGPERCHEQLDFTGVEDPGQSSHSFDQRHTPLVTMATAPGGHPSGHRVGGHTGIPSNHQIAEQARHRSQPALHRRRRQTGTSVADPHHVAHTGSGPLLAGDEGQHVLRRHLGRLLADEPEEDLQVVGIGPHRARSAPGRRELQEFVDHLVADPIGLLAVSIDGTLEYRTPLHLAPPGWTSTRQRLLVWSVQRADHPCKCRWRAPDDQPTTTSRPLPPCASALPVSGALRRVLRARLALPLLGRCGLPFRSGVVPGPGRVARLVWGFWGRLAVRLPLSPREITWCPRQESNLRHLI